jgi:hypothetical protein
MKFRVLAVSTLVAAASYASASLAQGDGTLAVEMSRMPQAFDHVTSGRLASPGAPSVLEGNRPASGMLPHSGPVRDVGTVSARSTSGSTDIRRGLRSD